MNGCCRWLFTYCEARLDGQGGARCITKNKAANHKLETEHAPSNVASSDNTSKEEPVVRLEVTQAFKAMRHELSRFLLGQGVLMIVDQGLDFCYEKDGIVGSW